MKKIHLSEKNKKVAGVLGGLGEVFDIDPTLLRLLFIVLLLATGILPAIIGYILAWMVIPRERSLTQTTIEL